MFSQVFASISSIFRTRQTEDAVVPVPSVLVTQTTQSTADVSSSSPPTVPEPAATSPTPAYYSSTQRQADAMADFFGALPSRTRTRDIPPPAYADEADAEKLPTYSGRLDDGSDTLARYMFLYGFFFPPFWLMGIAILFSTLSVSAEWHTEKSEEQRNELLAEMRKVELKWARRCLIAFMTLVAIIAIIVVVFVLVKRLH